MQGSSNRIVDEARNAKEKRLKMEIKNEEDETAPDCELSIDELAARELIREARNHGTVKTESKVFSLPLNESKFLAEGANEPTIDDYESVPISDYGMAMLRGMNWKEGAPIGRRTKKVDAPKMPELRPKGLGLGANKMVNANKPEENEKNCDELKLVKGAFAKIIAGNHRGHYCEVQGFDDDSSRIIVRTVLSKEVLSLNEFLVVPVTKDEYDKRSRVINRSQYEEYKCMNDHDRELSEKNKRRSRSHDKQRSVSKEESHGMQKRTKKKKSKKSNTKYSSEDQRGRRKSKHKKNKGHRSSDCDSDSEKKARRKRERNKKP